MATKQRKAKSKPVNVKLMSKSLRTQLKEEFKKELPHSVMMIPGPQAMEYWLGTNSDLFNITRVELLSALSNSSLRQVVTGKRKLSLKQYTALQEGLLPKLLQAVFILQNFGYDFIEKPVTG